MQVLGTKKGIAFFLTETRKNNTHDYKQLLLPIAFSKAISKTGVGCRLCAVTWAEPGAFLRCLLQREEAETRHSWAVGRSVLHFKSVWSSALHYGVKFSAKEKFLQVPRHHHSPNKLGMKWFLLTGLICSQGWSLFCDSIILFLAGAVGWQLLSDLWLFCRRSGNAGSHELPWILGSARVSRGFCASLRGGQALARLSVFKLARQASFEITVQVGTLAVSRLSAEQLQVRDEWEAAGKLQKCWCPHEDPHGWGRAQEAAFPHLHRQPGEQGESWEMIDWFLRKVYSEMLVLKFWCLWFQCYLYQGVEKSLSKLLGWHAIKEKKKAKGGMGRG